MVLNERNNKRKNENGILREKKLFPSYFPQRIIIFITVELVCLLFSTNTFLRFPRSPTRCPILLGSCFDGRLLQPEQDSPVSFIVSVQNDTMFLCCTCIVVSDPFVKEDELLTSQNGLSVPGKIMWL